MNALRPPTRRTFVRGLTVGVTSLALASPSVAQAETRIVVIGGGFGGTVCARRLKHIDQNLDVTLVEPNRTFTACPLSNEVIAGLRGIKAQQFTYDRISAEGVTVITRSAVEGRSAGARGRSRRRQTAWL